VGVGGPNDVPQNSVWRRKIGVVVFKRLDVSEVAHINIDALTYLHLGYYLAPISQVGVRVGCVVDFHFVSNVLNGGVIPR